MTEVLKKKKGLDLSETLSQRAPLENFLPATVLPM